MFMSCINILIFCFVKILAEYPPDRDKLPSTLKPDEKPDNSPPPIVPDPTTQSCRGDHCRPPPDLVGPIVGVICGVFATILIIVLILWFYFRRKNQNSKEVQMTPTIKYIEQPPLYTGAISTVDSTSRLYGMSPSRNDSIDSHHYEKINYNE